MPPSPRYRNGSMISCPSAWCATGCVNRTLNQNMGPEGLTHQCCEQGLYMGQAVPLQSALLGWSLGNAFTAAAVAHIDDIPAVTQDRMRLHLRSLIMHEPTNFIFGVPYPPQTWTPHIDTTIPVALSQPAMFTQWITAYFNHGDLSKRDLSTISYVVPSMHRTPTIYTMTDAERAAIIQEDQNLAVDTPFMYFFQRQLNACYRKAVFDKALRALVPKMKVWELCGEETASFAIPMFWEMEDENARMGGGFVEFEMIKAVNHFSQWDDPEKTLDAYLKALV